MYYKRKRKYRTKVVKMKFQSFVDLSTQADNMQIISVNAGGKDVLRRLAPFFAAYKYYKLGGVSIKLIPASTLPVSPSGLSYEIDEPTVDPRDQLTPGMCRITNGEDVLEDITGLTGDQQRELYNNMLLDSRWYKWMLQTGVKRFGKPKYWQVGQLHQDKWPGAIMNLPSFQDAVLGRVVKTETRFEYKPDDIAAIYASLAEQSDPRGFFQTGHRGVLGWLPTDGLGKTGKLDNGVREDAYLAAIPEIELFKILMPPMHKTNYYYRMFVTETVYFKEPIVMNVNGYTPLDVFHRMLTPGGPLMPTVNGNIASDEVIDIDTGGNDGGY